jgi:prepilin-type N-terminal cleavage/methylation domain-containing protein
MLQKFSRAFTLLELIIAMFIVTLLLGVTLTVTREIFGNEELRRTEQQLALFAKTARRHALRENRRYEMIFDEQRVELRPAAEYAEDDTPLFFEIPLTVSVQVKRRGNDEWETPRQWVWSFMPDGLCAPNRVRLQRGAAWVEETFNPLTANRQDETWYLP